MKTKSLGNIAILIIAGIWGLEFLYLGALFLYALVTKWMPHCAIAIAQWGNDVNTALVEHDWKLADGVLYGGIIVILVLRYRNSFSR